MCGIIGYSGKENALPILLEGLHSLEYRGYDSAGVAYFTDKGIETVKAKGRISVLEEKLEKEHGGVFTCCGIGHTRWATHGEPSDVNSHPHSTPRMSLVHNGIIENYTELREKLKNEGYEFVSETDTEAALKTIDSHYKVHGDPVKAITEALSEIKGSYAFGMIFDKYPDTVFASKKDSPLIVAVCDTGSFIASDLPAVLSHTNKYYRAEAGEIAILCGTDVRFFDIYGRYVEKKLETVDWTYEQAAKGGYPHFMLKEIFEEPEAVTKTVSGRISDGRVELGVDRLDEKLRGGIERIHIVACGTAMHAGLMGKYFIEKLARIPTDVEIASEFRYKNPILSKNDLFVVLSQSGETADTLAALRLAKAAGLYTLAVVNVVGSSVAREADGVIYTWAGPEIAVASTKAYTVQVSVLYLLSLRLAHSKQLISDADMREMLCEFADKVPTSIKTVLDKCDDIKSMCSEFSNKSSLFFIGRGVDYALAREASLKLKEVSYIHCEAYAAGELKHGTISLITEGVDVIAIVTENELFAKTLSNIKEVKARGAHVTLICDETLQASADSFDDIIRIPHTSGCLSGFGAATAFQLIAYYTAVMRKCDVDKPRNLAKSVTVE